MFILKLNVPVGRTSVYVCEKPGRQRAHESKIVELIHHVERARESFRALYF